MRPRERLGRRRRGDQHIFDHVDDAVRREHVRQDDVHAVDLMRFADFSMVIARAPRKRRSICWPREGTMKHARKAEG